MSTPLVMNFLNEAGKKTAVRINNVKEDITDSEAKAAMEVILAKNIFATSGGDLKAIDSAELIDKSSTDLSVK
ncbi:DUF2922 domain-containing protein [Clostridium sp. OS1-26]|uniref:DUF2922 domain-containing protein n=1 Tax=Clostridium sp. OS1-26 TaxID=3070681 RepID=UPI0027E117E6|nr:DUF2922 domain-containing protein [Clostridium sp. OS1-26]WML36749.1 DUF2922 domain-containing protein [Clostridium sp. OS1-26]